MRLHPPLFATEGGPEPQEQLRLGLPLVSGNASAWAPLPGLTRGVVSGQRPFPSRAGREHRGRAQSKGDVCTSDTINESELPPGNRSRRD